MSLISWQDLSQKEYSKPRFLVDPLVPQGGLVFLWGKSGLGKSPLTWHLAACVGSGQHFFGLPVTQGKVLYLEVDTPELIVQDRITKREPAENVWFLFMHPISAPKQIRQQDLMALREAAEIEPDLVVINTLRRAHSLDDKDSSTPSEVYGFYQRLFPGAALMFIHHRRKASTDSRATEHDEEDQSGSQHWINDCQTALRLEGRDAGEANLFLKVIKNQSAPKWPRFGTMSFLLGPDGTTLTSPLYERLEKVYLQMGEREEKGTAFDKAVAAELGVSTTTVYKARRTIEAGKFPGSREFLIRETEEESE